MAESEIQIERVDDIPRLIAQPEKRGIPVILNQVIKAHDNRQELRIIGWLAYISSGPLTG